MTNYKPYGVIPYNPGGPIDPKWNRSIELAMDRAQSTGDIKYLQSTINEYRNEARV